MKLINLFIVCVVCFLGGMSNAWAKITYYEVTGPGYTFALPGVPGTASSSPTVIDFSVDDSIAGAYYAGSSGGEDYILTSPASISVAGEPLSYYGDAIMQIQYWVTYGRTSNVIEARFQLTQGFLIFDLNAVTPIRNLINPYVLQTLPLLTDTSEFTPNLNYGPFLDWGGSRSRAGFGGLCGWNPSFLC